MAQLLVITGATGGLGAVVLEHLRNSYDCVALVRGSAPEGVRAIHADLADATSVRDAIRGLGAKPYGLVHLAGGFEPGALADTTDDVWAKMLGLNLTGAFVAIRETLAVMDPSEEGRIVAISSDAARTKAKGSVAYTVAKSALNTLIELTAKELAGTRITINALMPTSLDTPAMRQFAARETLVPLPRVAETIAFLLSPQAAHVHGALIPLTAR